jgi:hypothetical protein
MSQSRPSEHRSSGSRVRAWTDRTPIALAILLAVAAPAGCGDADALPDITKQAIAFDDVPAGVRDAARKAIPQVKFDEAWKNLGREGKLHSYEVRGRNPADGKIREVRVSVSGEILEQE